MAKTTTTGAKGGAGAAKTSAKSKPRAPAKRAPAKRASTAATETDAKALEAPKTTTKRASTAKAASKTTARKTPAPKPAASSKPEPAPEPSPAASTPETAGPGDLMQTWMTASMQGMQAFEQMTRSMTAAATATQKAALDVAANAKPEAHTPDPDPFNIADEAVEAWTALAANPTALADAQTRLWQGYMTLWTSAAQRAAGQEAAPVAAPGKGDKRWRNEDWENNPIFSLIRESYLLTSNWLVETVESLDGIDDFTKRKLAFTTRQMADAFAPTNFPMTNPEVIRTALQSGGENFVKGLRNLAEDMQRGKGRLAIRQTDLEKFQVGRDVATTPGQVVFQNDLIELIQYAPTTKTVHETPILIFPPWINKFYILDLRPENSMVKWLVDQGHTVFLASWVNPTVKHATKTFEDYMREGVHAGVDAVRAQTGAKKVNAVGYCIGGTLLASTLAHAAKTGDDRIASATFFAAQTDFSDAGDLMMFVDDDWMEEIEKRIDANGGVLDGQTMSDVYNMLRANDLIWSFVINNYLLGKDPRPFDLLFWNADQTNLGKGIHLFYLDNFYRKNNFSKGLLPLGGEELGVADITTPSFLIATKEDHIAPFRSVYRGAQKFSGPTTFVLSGSGHIAGIVNPPAAEKYKHWTAPRAGKLPKTADAWLETATEAPGSWWPTWDQWLAKYAGKSVPARDPAKGPLEPLRPAPGEHVLARA